MTATALTIALRSMVADEAIASVEIENGPMPDRDRYITKFSIMFPDVDKKVWGEYYDQRKAQKGKEE